ncbi:hypothetical protein TRVA0_003S01332 [Trichomonascus vanleenenianus]|uniref:uncharacterized protein n=1 Tax=Trichomonascus vanleenenianus TaxID=2268995 RepID=UPI003EC9D86D
MRRKDQPIISPIYAIDPKIPATRHNSLFFLPSLPLHQMEPSLVCKLLLTQLVYELGEDKFDEVSKALAKHPLVVNDRHRPTTAAKCEALYEQLLKNAGLERDEEYSGKPPAPWTQKLAELIYREYWDALNEDIRKDEQEFIKAAQLLEHKKT